MKKSLIVLIFIFLSSFHPIMASQSPIQKGIALLRKSSYNDCIQTFKSYLNASIKKKDIKGQAEAYYWLAKTSYELRRIKNAQEYAKKSLEFYKSAGNKSDLLRVNALIIDLLMSRGSYKDARMLMLSCEKGLNGNMAPDALGDFYLARAGIWYFRKSRELAIKNCEASLKLAMDNSDSYREALTLIEYAPYVMMIKKDEALDLRNKAEKIASRLNCPYLNAKVAKLSAIIEYYALNNTEEALKYYIEEGKMYKSTGNKLSEADNLIKIATILRIQNEPEKCIKAFNEAIAIIKKENATSFLLFTYEQKANQLFILNHFKKEKNQDYEEIKAEFERFVKTCPDPEERAGATLQLADIIEKMGAGHDEISDIIMKAEKTYESSGNKKEQIECIIQAVQHLESMYKYEEAGKLLEKALILRTAIGELDRYDDYMCHYRCNFSAIYKELGYIYKALGKNPEALDYYQKSVENAISEKNTDRILDNYSAMLVISTETYDIERALKYFREYIKTVPELKAPLSQARRYNDILSLLSPIWKGKSPSEEEQADIQFSLVNLLLEKMMKDGELVKRMKAGYSAWIDYTIKMKYKSDELDARRAYAQFNMISGSYNDAETQLEAALKLAEELNDMKAKCFIYSKISELLILEKKYGEARQIIMEQIATARKIDVKWFLSSALYEMGNLLKKIDENKEAEKYFAEARSIADKDEETKDPYWKAINLYYRKNDPEAAFVLFKQSLEENRKTGRKKHYIEALYHMADIFGRKKDYENAIIYNKEALEEAEKTSNIRSLQSIALQYGRILELNNMPDKAVEIYIKPINIVTSQWDLLSRNLGSQKLSKNSTIMILFERLIKLLLKSGRNEEAFKYIELSRSLEMIDSIKINELHLPEGQMKELIKKLQMLREKMSLINKEIESTRDEKRKKALSQILATTREEFFSAMNEIKSRNPDFEQLLNVRVSDMAALQKQIPEEVLLIEYYPAKDSVYIFEITSRSFSIKKKDIEREKLYEAIRNYRDRITKTGDSGFEKGKNELYSILIEPIEDDIIKKESIVIVPGGLLWYLPFETLGAKSGDYLIKKKNISYLSSASVLNLMLEKKSSINRPKKIMLIGAPPDCGLSGTGKEISEISSIYPESIILRGKESTKSNFMKNAEKSSVIHIASHSVLDRENLNNSYIQMADGRLSLGEIYGLILSPSSVVILSSCESLIGEDNPGCEFTGLASTFTTAGASSVIASEWKVEDISTSQLFINFYRFLKENKSKAASLRLAKLSMLENPRTSHPFYWGSFILMGDWN